MEIVSFASGPMAFDELLPAPEAEIGSSGADQKRDTGANAAEGRDSDGAGQSQNDNESADAADDIARRTPGSLSGIVLAQLSNQLDHAGSETEKQEDDFEEAGTECLVQQVADAEANQAIDSRQQESEAVVFAELPDEIVS